MKHHRVLALVLALCLCLGIATVASAAPAATSFPDFDSTQWYAPAVQAAVENGLLIGDNHGRLRPQDAITRAEMAAVLNRAFGTYKTTSIQRFRDVKTTDWFYKDLQMAYHMGTYEGTSASTMAPRRDISRQEAMTVVARALQLNLNRYRDTDLSDFSDSCAISDWALPYVRAMVGAGYIQGRNGKLAPQDAITRAEFAQVFHNIIGTYLTEEGTYTESFTGNVLIRTGDVTLSNLTVDGDLILGCGVAEDAVTLSNVTVTGRLVVWGGGTDAVFCNEGTKMPEVLVCRVDNAVKVIYDRDSTLAVYDDIQVGITARAKAFPETEVIFYDISDILEEQENLDQTVTDQQISVTVPAALPVSVVDGKVLTASSAAIRNHGKDPVAVTAISVKPGAYDIGSFDHFSGLAGTIALYLNGCGTTGAGSLPMTDAAFPAIEAGESLALRYQAKVALADTQDHAAAASVVFTISIVD